jgi:hypothetical protein
LSLTQILAEKTAFVQALIRVCPNWNSGPGQTEKKLYPVRYTGLLPVPYVGVTGQVVDYVGRNNGVMER